MLVSWLRQLSARLTIDSTTSKRRRNPRRQNPHLPVWAIVLEQRDLLAGFTPGNLVVSTVGTGAALDASATVVTLREYGFDSLDTPTTATLVNSVAAPSANLGNNSGNLTDAGNAGSDAAMNLTADGTGVIVMGYDAPLGVASVFTTTSATNNRVIGIADAAGTLTVGPRLTDAFSGGNARAVASVDGSRFWVGGSPGVRYVSTNTATTSTPIITSLPPAVRFVTIATDRNNNQFLVGNTATGVFVWRTPGPTLPTLATQPLTLPLSTGSDLGEVVMLDRSPSIGATGLGGIDTIYVTNGQNLATGGSIAKYEWNGSSWVSRSSRSYSSSGLNGLTARATATGQVQLFATTRATTGNNELLYRLDTSAFGSDMSLGTYTVLATSSAGYGFRGVSFTPDEATAAPLTLGTASLANAGGAAVNLLGDVSFVDGSTFNGGLLAVSGGQLGDVVSIKNVPGQITTSDNTVLYNGTPIGIVSGGTDTNALRVDFNARNDVHRVTKAMIESLLEQLQFSTTSASSNRTLNLTVNQAVDHKSQMDSFNATTTIAINQPPSRLELLNTTASIAEQTVGGSGLKLADIVVDDDAFGTNVLAVSGVDADAFEIVDNALYLKAGTILNAAIQNSYSITVTVDDPLAGIAIDLSANYTLALVAANRAPTAVTLTNGLSSLPENTNTSGGMQVAEFTITDDPFGTNEVSLAGANAAFFELRGSELWLKDGVVLDFESQEFLAVVIEIDDPSVGDSPDATATYTLPLTNVNEAPTAVTLQNVTSSLPEQTLANDLKIAEIAVTDDALGTNAITLSGADAAAFTVVGTSLFLKAGTYDFETKPAFTVTIQVDDTAVGGSSDATTNYTLSLTDVVEAPEIEVTLNDNPVAPEGSVAWGTVTPGTATTRTFTVKNTGAGILTLQPISLIGSDFLLTSPNFAVGQTLAVNTSVTFTVTMNTVSAGTKTGSLSFANDDPNEPVYQIHLNGVVAASSTSTLFIDDGDAGFSTAGTWNSATGYGVGNDAKAATGSDGTKTATWTFTGLAPGTYRIDATWLPGTDRASTVPYTFRDGVGGPIVGTSLIDQRHSPSGAAASDGRPFGTLGMVTITGDTLVVQLVNTATNGAIIADAIRLEFLPATITSPWIEVKTDGLTLFDAGRLNWGTATQGEATLTRTITVRNAGNANLILQPVAVSGTGFSLVSPNFAVGQSLAPNTMIDITVQLSTATPGKLNGSLSFGHNADGPFDLQFDATVYAALSAGAVLIDDGDAGFSVTGLWNSSAGYGYGSDVKAATGSDGSKTATWTFAGLTAGTYQIDATWTPGTDRANNALYSFRDGLDGTVVSRATINQRNAPAGATTGRDRPFATIETVTITGDTLVVQLSNTATNGAIIADAIRIMPVTPTPNTPEIAVLDGEIAVNDGFQHNFGSVTQGTVVTKSFVVKNIGTADLILQPITFTGSGFSLASTNFHSGQILVPNATATITVVFNTSTLGTFAGGLRFANNDADESSFDLMLNGTVNPVPPTTYTIDDGDAGFALSGAWNNQANYGFGGDAKAATGNDGSKVATWTFTGLAAGTYQIDATWLSGTDRANNVPYSFFDGVGGPSIGSALINQRNNPTGATSSGGRPFGTIGTVTITGNTLVIRMANSATSGAIIADAIRLTLLT